MQRTPDFDQDTIVENMTPISAWLFIFREKSRKKHISSKEAMLKLRPLPLNVTNVKTLM